jgi:hypothetical protein
LTFTTPGQVVRIVDTVVVAYCSYRACVEETRGGNIAAAELADREANITTDSLAIVRAARITRARARL